MAVKKKTRSRSKAKKSNVGRNLLILGAVAGGAWAGWKFLIQPRLQAKAEAERLAKEAQAQAQGGASAVASAIQQAQAVVPNALPQVEQKKNRLSPIGTPFDKINKDAKVFFGDKGAEVQFIQIYVNKIRQIIGGLKQRGLTNAKVPAQLDQDGIYGKNTLQALTDLKLTGAGGVNAKIIVSKKKEWDDIYKDLYINYVQSAQDRDDLTGTPSAYGSSII